jgi:23S rRNA pseudouridine2605 synthase
LSRRSAAGAADERIQKTLAQRGIGSRRQIEEWIRAGRVQVNGRPATLGQRVRPGDRIVVDGREVTRRLKAENRPRAIVYHKPAGEMLRARAGDERPNVEAHLPALHGGRWVAVNPIGYAEDGLLVLTSDGALASRAGRAGRLLPVEYRVRALRPERLVDWPQLPLSVVVDGVEAKFASIEPAETGGTNQWFKVTANQAVPRGAVRALFDSAGLKVSRTLLIAWGPFRLPRDLPRGRSRELRGPALEAVLQLASGGATSGGVTSGRATARRNAGR